MAKTSQRIYQLYTFTTASTTGTVTGSGTTGIIGGLSEYEYAAVTLQITAVSGTTTLDAYLDTRLDGTNWGNIAHFPLITGTAQHILALSRTLVANSLIATSGADAGAGTVRNIPFGDDLRMRQALSGTSVSISGVWTLTLWN